MVSTKRAKVTLKTLRDLIHDLRESSSSEADTLADLLDNALKDRADAVEFAIFICNAMEDWAQISRKVLQGKQKSI